VLDASGAAVAEVPLAIEDRKTSFRVTVRDILMGAEASGSY
jgi:hypothetical protein